MAISAARTNSSAEAATSGRVATPTDAVSLSFNPAAFEERMGAQSLTNTVSYRRGTLGTGVGQDECKLVATKARDDVGFSRAAANHRCGFHERPAAGLVPVCIVDPFETVEVQEEQR